MKIEMINMPTLKNVLHCYSGRRLQFAIKLGILPTPETLSLALSKELKAKKPILASSIMRISTA